MVLNVVGSNPIGHPSSNPLQLCVVRDFFCLSTSSPSRSLLSARPTTVRQDSGRCPLPACPFPRASAFVVAAVRVERLHLIGSAARLLTRFHTCPNARGSRKRFAPLHRRMRSGANRQLGWGGDAPGAAAFLEKTVGTCRNVHFLARGSACAHRNFSFFAFTLHLLV